MHFGHKDTEDESDRTTFFLQFRPLQENTVSRFTFSSSFSPLVSTFFKSEEDEEEDDKEDEADAGAAASSPTPTPLSSNTLVDDDADAAGIEVARVDEAVGMGGGKKSSSSPAPRCPPPAFFTVVADFAGADVDIAVH